MTQLSTNQLITETKELVGAIRRNFIAIAANLYQIHEGWTASADEWVNFYQEELELDKSTVSKLLKVGGFVVAHGFLKSTEVGYQNLYKAIVANPDEEPQKVLAIATTWKKEDFKDQVKEDCKNPDYVKVCKNCWATPEKHA